MKTCMVCGDQLPKQHRKYCLVHAGAKKRKPHRFLKKREDGAIVVETRCVSADQYRDKTRASRLRDKYDISIAEYDAILSAQGGRCAICDRPPMSQRFACDHDHAHAKKHGKRESIRGLLCWSCNYWLVRKGVTPAMLRAAASYLEHPPAVPVLGTHGIQPPTRAGTPVDPLDKPALMIEDL